MRGSMAACAASMEAPLSAATVLVSSSADFSDPAGGDSAFYRYDDTDGLAATKRYGEASLSPTA